jgi:polyisoprenoid-binding protein YceI
VPRYVISPERSHVWIDAKSNVHPIHSSTGGLEGFVELSFASGGGVDMNATSTAELSLAVSLLSSGNRLEDRELQKRIDARKFPTITGVLGSIEPSEATGTYRVGGDITFRGISLHHEDLMQITSVDDDTIQLDGHSHFDIREYGMDPPRMLMLRVEPEVDIRVEIFAVKEGV